MGRIGIWVVAMAVTTAIAVLYSPPAGAADAPAEADWRQVVLPEHRPHLESTEALVQRFRDYPVSRYEDITEAEVKRLLDVAAFKPIDPKALIGKWRCRIVMFVQTSAYAYPFFDCVIARQGGRLVFTKTTGSQQRRGLFYADDGQRLVYLGRGYYRHTKDKRTAYGAAETDRAEGSNEIGLMVGLGRDHRALFLPDIRYNLQIIELRR